MITMNRMAYFSQFVKGILKGTDTIGYGWIRTLLTRDRHFFFQNSNAKREFAPYIGHETKQGT